MAGIDILSLEETTITTDLAGKILAFYGTNNTGKSFVAAHLFPGKTLWLATEKGYNAIGKMRKVDIETWSDFRSMVAQLTTRNKTKREKVREMYDCVVVDVADRLPNLCTAYTIQQYNEAKTAEAESTGREYTPITELSGVPYGGGYASLNKEIDAQVNKLALSGFCVVLIFHDEVKKMNANKADEYEYIIPKNTFSKAGNVLKDLPDFTIYLEPQGVDDEGHAVLSVGHCVQHKEFFARSRFTECPEIIAPFTAENVKQTVQLACEREAETQGAKTVTYAEEDAVRQAEKEGKKLSANDLRGMIEPVFKALIAAKFKTMTMKIVEQYLGVIEDEKTGKERSMKISEADDTKVDALQCIYDKLVDFANDKEVDYE